MWSKRDIIIFCAGAEVFHTISHLFFAVSGTLPIHFLFITWDQSLNTFAIIANLLITAGLFWWLNKLQ